MTIEINNVSKSFGPVQALDSINLTLEEQGVYGLLGNNGAGKTTLLNIITNRLYADSGLVSVDGEPAADNDRALGKIFMMGEKNLYPEDMRVRRALDLTAGFYPDYDREQAYALAERFGLNPKKKIASLSTGYQSIFRLVLALSVNTPYLLLDEPVLGLDAQHRDLFYKLLMEKYAERPCCILLSTHLISEAAPLIEQAIIIRQGRLLRMARTEELLSHGYTVSGPAAPVDDFIRGRRILSVSSLGGLKTASIEETPPQTLPPGLEQSPLTLQDYFIQLMNEEDAHHEC